MFDTLNFKPVREGHWQAKEQFGKYQLSIVLLPGKTLYEAAIFQDDNFVQLPGINYDDDVIPGLTKNMVTSIMQKLELIKIAS